MSTTPDFSKLYAQLNLRPDCSLEDFKHAYRRRVATLHPDRHMAGNSPTSKETISLPDLMSLYGVAMQFQKEHGRLPGAPVTGKFKGPLRPLRDARQTPARAVKDDGIPRRGWLLLAGLLAFVIYLFISATPDAPTHAGTSSHQQQLPNATATTTPAGPDYIAVGMDTAAVLSLQGRPSRTSEELWEYGPSWIRFEKGLVVDWYSSPLYRLRSSGQPAPSKRPSKH